MTKCMAPISMVTFALAACGASDAIAPEEGRIGMGQIALANTDDAYLPYGVRSNWTGGAFSGPMGTFFADVTGDRKADAIASLSNGLFIRRSSGAGFSSNETWSSLGFWGGS